MNKKIKNTFLTGVLGTLPLAIIPISSKCTNQFMKKLSTEESEKILENNKSNNNFILLDVRTQGEINEQYIEGMINIDYRSENFENEVNKLDKNKTYLIYCRTQNRSQEAAKIMKKLGFKYLYWMDGGITQWQRENRKVIKVNHKIKNLLINSQKSFFLKNEDINFSVKLENTNSGVLVFEFELIDEKKNIIKKVTKEMPSIFNSSINDIFENRLNLNENENYTLRITCPSIKDVNEANFNFKITSDTNLNKTIDFYKNNGAYNHFQKNNSNEINNDFINKYFGHNIYQYKTLSMKKEIIKIDNLIDKKKKSIVLFASPTCLSCLVYLEKLTNYNLKNYNYIKLLTSVGNDVDEYIELSKESFNEKNITPELESSLLDNQDLIWQTKLNFQTTPKILLVDEFGRIVNGIDSLNNFEQEFEEIFEKTFNEKIEKNIKKPEPENPIPTPEDPKNPDLDDDAKKQFMTFDQRLKIEVPKFNQLSAKDIEITQQLYGINVSGLRIQKNNDEFVKFSEIISKNNNKPTIILFGHDQCGACANALSFFKNNYSEEYNFIDFLAMRSSKTNWEYFIEKNSSKSKIDKQIFRHHKFDWSEITKHSRFVPQGFVLDKKNNITYAFHSNYSLGLLLVKSVKDTISVKE